MRTQNLVNLMGIELELQYLENGECESIILDKEYETAALDFSNNTEVAKISVDSIDMFSDSKETFSISQPTVKVINLPEAKEGVYLIVPLEVAMFAKRADLITPDSKYSSKASNYMKVSNFLRFA